MEVLLGKFLVIIFLGISIVTLIALSIALIDLIITTKKDWEEYKNVKTIRRNGRKTGKED